MQLFGALIPPLVAFVLQWALWELIEPLVWFLFYPAVFISSWIGGRRSGVIATVISIALVWWFFIPPQYSLAKAPTHFFSIGMFLTLGVLFGIVHERLRTANQKAGAMVMGARSHHLDGCERLRDRLEPCGGAVVRVHAE